MAIRPADYHSRRRKFIEESMPRTDLHCLHGTFQHPGVWADLEARLGAGIRVLAETIELPATGRMPAWADAYCARLGRDAGDDTAARSGRRALLGYSLGGRLAMHALVACPAAWDGAVLVSAHPGGGSPEELAAVRRRDERWAARCRREPLAGLLGEWDALPVFGGHPNRAPRRLDALDSGRQAQLLEAFTRGEQADLRPALAAAPLPPILYVTGADDPRYGELGAELAGLLPSLSHVVLPEAGHRVPWDRSGEFAALVREFLGSMG